MAATYIDLIREVEKRLLNDKIQGLIRAWLNQAQREICAVQPFTFLQIERGVLAKTATPNYYTLPTDFTAALGVRYKDPEGNITTLQVHPVEDLDATFPDQTVVGTVPEVAVFTGGLLLLNPPPESVGTAPNISRVLLRHLREPPDMQLDTDRSIIPAIHRDSLILKTVEIGGKWLWSDEGMMRRAERQANEAIAKMIVTDRGHTDKHIAIGHEPGKIEAIRRAGTSG